MDVSDPSLSLSPCPSPLPDNNTANMSETKTSPSSTLSTSSASSSTSSSSSDDGGSPSSLVNDTNNSSASSSSVMDEQLVHDPILLDRFLEFMLKLLGYATSHVYYETTKRQYKRKSSMMEGMKIGFYQVAEYLEVLRKLIRTKSQKIMVQKKKKF